MDRWATGTQRAGRAGDERMDELDKGVPRAIRRDETAQATFDAPRSRSERIAAPRLG